MVKPNPNLVHKSKFWTGNSRKSGSHFGFLSFSTSCHFLGKSSLNSEESWPYNKSHDDILNLFMALEKLAHFVRGDWKALIVPTSKTVNTMWIIWPRKTRPIFHTQEMCRLLIGEICLTLRQKQTTMLFHGKYTF